MSGVPSHHGGPPRGRKSEADVTSHATESYVQPDSYMGPTDQAACISCIRVDGREADAHLQPHRQIAFTGFTSIYSDLWVGRLMVSVEHTPD